MYAFTRSHIPTVRSTAAFILCALLILIQPAGAQEGETASDPKTESAEVETAKGASSAVTADPNVPTENLELLLLPLTQDELLIEAEAWRDLVKANAREISEAKIAKKSEPDTGASPEGTSELQAALEEKTGLLAKFNLAIDAYEEKGGDPAELRKYAEAVSGVSVEVTDVGGAWDIFRAWLTSKDGGIKWLVNFVKFIVILIIFWILSKIASRFVRRAISSNVRISHLLKQFINRLVARTVLVIGLLVALSTVGFNVGALLALIGGGAFIVGFALQDSLSNFASGMMLLIYRPFDVGDAVEVGGVNGKVDSVSLVSTTIRTFDNKVVLVPNKMVWGEIITNASASPERRVDLIFGIGYEDDIAKAQEIIEGLVANHELVLEEPAPVIKVNELADSSVNFICRPWAKTPDYWNVYWDLTRAVKESFDREGISIPFPQQDVYLHTVESDGKNGSSKSLPEIEPTGAASSSPNSSDTSGTPPNDYA